MTAATAQRSLIALFFLSITSCLAKDVTPPSVSLTAPAPNSELKGSTHFVAKASDNVGVARVDMQVDGKVVATEKIAPYDATVDTVKIPNGPHTLTAVAFDAAGNKETSHAVAVTVKNSPVPPPPPPPTPSPAPNPPPPPVIPPPPPSAGWSDFKRAPDALVFYVSTQGVDSNSGTDVAKPLKTLAAGYAKLRTGKPDWLLLKSGDTWQERFPYWQKSGRSSTEPLLISSYGVGARPIVSGDAVLNTHDNVSFVAVIGLRITNLKREPGQPGFLKTNGSDSGIRWMSTGTGFLLEDSVLDFHRVGFVAEQPIDAAPSYACKSYGHDIKIRRSVIANNWAEVPLPGKQILHSQGLYLSCVDGLLLEQNFVDSNGYLTGVVDRKGTPMIFNHNTYVQADSKNIVVRENIFSRAAATGIQVRPGGMVDGNIFLQNPIGLTLGATNGGHAPVAGGVAGEIKNNVFSQGVDIDPTTPRGGGMNLGNSKSVMVHDNVFSVTTSPTHYHGAIEYDCANGAGLQALTIKDNMFYRYEPKILFNSTCGSKAVMSNNLSDQTSWPKPGNMIADYDSAFFEKARRQSKSAWDEKLTAVGLAKWFKAGFAH